MSAHVTYHVSTEFILQYWYNTATVYCLVRCDLLQRHARVTSHF